MRLDAVTYLISGLVNKRGRISTSRLIMMRRYVLNPRDSPYPCRGKLGGRDDFPITRLGPIGQRTKGRAGIHGVVSISSAPISSDSLGSHGDTPDHRPNAVVTARSQSDATSCMAWGCDHEAVAGRPVALPDLAA